jgi:hypothetical protein
LNGTLGARATALEVGREQDQVREDLEPSIQPLVTELGVPEIPGQQRRLLTRSSSNPRMGSRPESRRKDV